jgi:hypothetical protein
VTHSKILLLKKHLEGDWIYEGRRQWFCKTTGRRIRYTAPPVDEFDNICGPSQCWIDTPGQPTKPFSWWSLCHERNFFLGGFTNIS